MDSFRHSFGHPHTAALSSREGCADCVFLSIDGTTAASATLDDGEIRHLEWLTPPAWLDRETATDLVEDLLDLDEGAQVEICEPAASIKWALRSAGVEV